MTPSAERDFEKGTALLPSAMIANFSSTSSCCCVTGSITTFWEFGDGDFLETPL